MMEKRGGAVKSKGPDEASVVTAIIDVSRYIKGFKLTSKEKEAIRRAKVAEEFAIQDDCYVGGPLKKRA